MSKFKPGDIIQHATNLRGRSTGLVIGLDKDAHILKSCPEEALTVAWFIENPTPDDSYKNIAINFYPIVENEDKFKVIGHIDFSKWAKPSNP